MSRNAKMVMYNAMVVPILDKMEDKMGVHYRDGDEQNCARKTTKRKANEQME